MEICADKSDQNQSQPRKSRVQNAHLNIGCLRPNALQRNESSANRFNPYQCNSQP